MIGKMIFGVLLTIAAVTLWVNDHGFWAIIIAIAALGAFGEAYSARPRKEVVELAGSTKYADIDGTRFPVTSDDQDFWNNVQVQRPSSLLMDIRDVEKKIRATAGHFGENAYRPLHEFGEFRCFGCHFAYRGKVTLAFLGVEAAGKSPDACPRCGNKYVLWTFQMVSPATEADIFAIRKLFRERARALWAADHSSSKEIECARCETPISRDEGYLYESQIYCEGCVPIDLKGAALYHLREDPNYFGKGLLMEARHRT